jgi:hypothetical protein
MVCEHGHQIGCAIEKESSRRQEHVVSIPRSGSVKQRISGIEWCTKARVIGGVELVYLAQHVRCKSGVIQDQMTNEVIEQTVFLRCKMRYI